MRLFYIDESGTGLKDKASPYFVLAALIVVDRDVSSFDRAVAALKRRLIGWAKPEDFEIKGRDIRRGEKFFKQQDWEQRLRAMRSIADLIAEQPCSAVAVVVDKRDLPEYVGTDDDLYRIAFWRLLDELDADLVSVEDSGLLMVDSRSDLHHSVQDRRLIDAYREWVASRAGATRFIEVPWFGFSAFYAGLQLADFTAYMMDFASHEEERAGRFELNEVFSVLKTRLRSVHIP